MKKFLLALALSVVGSAFSAAPTRPNIVFIITDDQGYGDLGYTGNPVVKTPFIDKLAVGSTNSLLSLPRPMARKSGRITP